MWTLENNKSDLLRLFNGEQKMSRWFVDAIDAKYLTVNGYIEWCKQFWRIYELRNKDAALFVEKTGEIHFMIMPKTPIDGIVEELTLAKNDIFREKPMIFGWVHSKNRGLKALCETMGLHFYGVRKFAKQSHGKVIEWQCFQVFRENEVVAPNLKNVLLLKPTK